MVKRVTTQYSIINEDPDFFINVDAETLNDFYASSTPESLQNHNLKINTQLFLDILLLEIRRETIYFSSRRKKKRVAEEKLTLHEIETLQKQLMQPSDEATFKDLNEQLHAEKCSLEEIYAYQAQGAYIRARAKYDIEGEKPTKLFCSLEKHNRVQKHISKLIVENTTESSEIVTQESIENEICRYY